MGILLKSQEAPGAASRTGQPLAANVERWGANWLVELAPAFVCAFTSCGGNTPYLLTDADKVKRTLQSLYRNMFHAVY
jgi:hypothetical protein